MAITITSNPLPPDPIPPTVVPPQGAAPQSSGPAVRATLSHASTGIGAALAAPLAAGHSATAAMTKPQTDAAHLNDAQGVLQQIQRLLAEATDPALHGADRQAIEVSITGLQGQLGDLTDQTQAGAVVPGLASTQAQIVDLQLSPPPPPAAPAQPPPQSNTPNNSAASGPTGTATVAGVDVRAAASGPLPAHSPEAAGSSMAIIAQTLEQIHQRQVETQQSLSKQQETATSADSERISIFQRTPLATASAATAAATKANAQIWAAPAAAISANGDIAPAAIQSLLN